MSELILSLVVGAVVALALLAVQQAWERYSQGPNRRHRPLGVRGLWQAPKAWAARVVAGRRQLSPARPEHRAVDRSPAVAARELDSLLRVQVEPTAVALRGGAASSDPETVPEGSSTMVVPVPGEPGLPGGASQAAKRRRSLKTIAVDPLEAPRDPHRTRVAAGAIIHELEVGKIEHPR